MKSKDVLLVFFVSISFVFALFCLIMYFGGIDMDDKRLKWNVFMFLCIVIVVVVPLFYVVFFTDEKYDYSNAQEIDDSGITVVYTDKNKKKKICYVKYYDESELQELILPLDKSERIYISKDTPLDKCFFEKLKCCDYEIKFSHANVEIEIKGK